MVFFYLENIYQGNMNPEDIFSENIQSGNIYSGNIYLKEIYLENIYPDSIYPDNRWAEMEENGTMMLQDIWPAKPVYRQDRPDPRQPGLLFQKGGSADRQQPR